jgi:hypothetical protein
MYAVLDKHGNVVTVTETRHAAAVAGEALPGEGMVAIDYAYQELLDNPVPVREGLLAPKLTPERALKLTGLRPMGEREVMSMSVEEAYERVHPFFPTRMYVKKTGEWRDVKVYRTAEGLADGLIGQNYKTAKQPKGLDRSLTVSPGNKGINVQGLSLLPHGLGSMGLLSAGADPRIYGVRRVSNQGPTTLCAGSTKECRSVCLVYSGHNPATQYNYVVKAARTHALRAEPVAFVRLLTHALERHFGARTKAVKAARLNVYSDIPWELAVPWLFSHTGGQYYDYTKVPDRRTPQNYDLTFSYAGTAASLKHVEHEILVNRRRIATVFVAFGEGGKLRRPEKGRRGLPETWMGLKVVDGDTHDLRPLDPPNVLYEYPVVVGLRYKAPKSGDEPDTKAFLVPIEEVDGALVASVVPRMFGAEDFAA